MPAPFAPTAIRGGHKPMYDDIRQAVTPLRMIFWGALLCIFDLTFSSSGFRFDILNDFVGALLIAIGVARLGKFVVDDVYAGCMRFAWIMAVLAVLEAALDHFVFPRPEVLQIVLSLVGLASLAATVLFCYCMQRLSQHHGLERSAASWRTTTVLFLVIYGIPLGLLHLAGLFSRLVGEKPFEYDLGPAGLLLLLVFVVPVVHLFVSTNRMIRESENPPFPPGGGLPV